MGSFNIPVSHAVGHALGAGTGVAITVGNIKTTDVLLAVFSLAVAGGSDATGHDPAAFTLNNGSIQSASVSTANRRVVAIWQTK